MTDYVFDSVVAIDPATGFLATNAVGQVYAEADTTETTPLVVTDSGGIDMATVQSGPVGVLETFIVADYARVWWVSGGFKILLTSYTSILEAAEDAAASAELSRIAAEAAAAASSIPAGGDDGDFLGKSDGALAWLPAPVGTGGSGITGAPASWPATFPASPHSHPSSEINDATTTGRNVMRAASPAAARTAIGAAPDTVVSFPGFGGTAGTAVPGNRVYQAIELQFTPAGTITATTVQAAIEQAALSGGGGGSVPTGVIVGRRYASGAYPVRGTLPAGTIVDWQGPTSPTIGGAYAVAGVDTWTVTP